MHLCMWGGKDVSKNNEWTIVFRHYLDPRKHVLPEVWGRTPLGHASVLTASAAAFSKRMEVRLTLRCWTISLKGTSVIRHMSREPGTGWAALGSNSFPTSWRLNFWSPKHSAFLSSFRGRENNLELHHQGEWVRQSPVTYPNTFKK